MDFSNHFSMIISYEKSYGIQIETNCEEILGCIGQGAITYNVQADKKKYDAHAMPSKRVEMQRTCVTKQ